MNPLFACTEKKRFFTVFYVWLMPYRQAVMFDDDPSCVLHSHDYSGIYQTIVVNQNVGDARVEIRSLLSQSFLMFPFLSSVMPSSGSLAGGTQISIQVYQIYVYIQIRRLVCV